MMKLMDELIANYREQINQRDEEIEALLAENARLREALNNIAAELTDIDKESCDFEGAYDLLIRAARAAMGESDV